LRLALELSERRGVRDIGSALGWCYFFMGLGRRLAELFSSYASQVLPILKSNSSIADAELHRQMDELLAKPWQASLVCRIKCPLSS